MCIIDVKAGMRYVTVAQAMAHNVSTIERDMDFLRKYLTTNVHRLGNLEAQKRLEALARVEKCAAQLHIAYDCLLDNWQDALCAELECGKFEEPDPLEPKIIEPTGHTHDHDHDHTWAPMDVYHDSNGNLLPEGY